MAFGLSRRITELLEWLDVERGADRQLGFEPTGVPFFRMGDLSLFGPVQSRTQNWAHGPLAAVAAVFGSVTLVAGPHGCWVSHFSTGAGAYRVMFVAQPLANNTGVFVEREDVAVPGLVPTVIEPFQFGQALYSAAVPMPLGSVLQGGTQAAPSGGILVGSAATINLTEPIYIPPGQGITCCLTIANTIGEMNFRIVESLAFFGRNFGDRPGLST